MSLPIRSIAPLRFSMIKAQEILIDQEKDALDQEVAPQDFISRLLKSLSLPEAFVSASSYFFQFNEKHFKIASEEDLAFIFEQMIAFQLPVMYPEEWPRWVACLKMENYSDGFYDRIFSAIDQTHEWSLLKPFLGSDLLNRRMLPHLISKFSSKPQPRFEQFLIEQLADIEPLMIVFLKAILKAEAFDGSFPGTWKLLLSLKDKTVRADFATHFFHHLLKMLLKDPAFESWSIENMLKIENGWRELETTFQLQEPSVPRMPKLNKNRVLTLSIESKSIRQSIVSALSSSLRLSKEIPQKMKDSIKNISQLPSLSIEPFKLQIDLVRNPELAYIWVESLLRYRLTVPLITPFINGLGRNTLYQLITNRADLDIERITFLLYNNLTYIPLPLYSVGLLESRGASELALLLAQRNFESKESKTHFLQCISVLSSGRLNPCSTQMEKTLGILALDECVHKLIGSHILTQALRARSIISRYQAFWSESRFDALFKASQVEIAKLIIEEFSNQNLCAINLDRFPELLDMAAPIALKFKEQTDFQKNLILYAPKAYQDKVKANSQLDRQSFMNALKRDVKTLVCLKQVAVSLNLPKQVNALCALWAEKVCEISHEKAVFDPKEWLPAIAWMRKEFEEYFAENTIVSNNLQNIG